MINTIDSNLYSEGNLHFGIPPFHQIKVTYPGLKLKALYLSFDRNDKVEYANFITEDKNWKSSLSFLCDWIIGKGLREALSDQRLNHFPSGELFNIGFWLIYSAKNMRDGNLPHAGQLRGKRPSDLICRCFGVYGETIKESLESNRQIKIDDIKRDTLAGAGCGECSVWFENAYNQFINQYRSPNKKMPERNVDGTWSLFEERSPFFWLSKIAPSIKHRISSSIFANRVSINRFAGNTLFLSTSSEVILDDKLESQLIDWERELEIEFGVKFRLEVC